MKTWGIRTCCWFLKKKINYVFSIPFVFFFFSFKNWKHVVIFLLMFLLLFCKKCFLLLGIFWNKLKTMCTPVVFVILENVSIVFRMWYVLCCFFISFCVSVIVRTKKNVKITKKQNKKKRTKKNIKIKKKKRETKTNMRKIFLEKKIMFVDLKLN